MNPKIRMPAMTRVVMTGRRMKSSGNVHWAFPDAAASRILDLHTRTRNEPEMAVGHDLIPGRHALLDHGLAADSFAPTVTGRDSTVESGRTTYTYWPCWPV